MTITEAFKQYNAFLKNIDLSICAENSDGELVIRLWGHCITKPTDSVIQYKDHIPRCSGPGNYELGLALDKAKETNQVIRAVIAHSENLKKVETGQDANRFKNNYTVCEDWIGSLVFWDGSVFDVRFKLAKAC